MENVQGLQYRLKDGPNMQFWPIQHDFFPKQAQNQVSTETHVLGHTSVNESSGSRHDVSMWEKLNGKHLAPANTKDWKGSWEWDSILLTGKPTLNQHDNVITEENSAHTQSISVNSSFPLNNTNVNGGRGGLTSLELGLNTRASDGNNDDNLLALKLGGNGHLFGADDLYPNVKRSRHSPPENQPPRCQVDNCTADLQNAKDYHRRHKVCEFHAKATKAPVSRIMQRFCQQCSRFHLLQEFDDDRRSCRRRLAGHNRRRRKTQPDSIAALASILADQSALSRNVNPLSNLQGKDDLERLLKILGGGGDTLIQALISASAEGGDAGSKSVQGPVPSNELVNAIAKSQILSNLLLSTPNIARSLPAFGASTDTPISSLSNALLLSLAQLQQKNSSNGNHVSASEVGRQSESSINIFNQYFNSRECNNREQASFASKEKLRDPATTSDKSNESNEDSSNEKFPRVGMNGIRSVPDAWPQSIQHIQTANTANAAQQNTQSLSPDAGGLGSDHSSESGLDKQDQTCQLWFKIFDRGPADLPSSLRKQMLKWLDNLPTEMEGYIRPGCIILTIFLCMPTRAWFKLCSDIERNLYKLLQMPDAEFWRKGRVLVYLGDASALIVDGKVHLNQNRKLSSMPKLITVQPFAIPTGEKVCLTLKGPNLGNPETRVICAYGGKCISNEVDETSTSPYHKKRERDEGTMPPSDVDASQEQAITFNVGPFSDEGHGFIEVEGEIVKGNSFPVVVANKAICKDLGSLEEEFLSISSLNSGSPQIQNDITHFLYEFGWLLHRNQLQLHTTNVDLREFSPSRYIWLLRFSVGHNFCAVTGRILDLMFSMDGDVTNSKAIKVLSEANLLYLAVRNKSTAMVEFLLSYSSANAKQTPIFRPDTPGYAGLTPLHVAASLQDAVEIVDALTNGPEEFWATAWMDAKDSVGQTPFMYAVSSGNATCVELVQSKLLKNGKINRLERENVERAQHLALNISSEVAKPSSPIKGSFTNQLHQCTCKSRENLPVRIRGINGGMMYRPLVLSILAIAAVCVCVGVLMKGPPSVNFVQGPFVWESIGYGFM